MSNVYGYSSVPDYGSEDEDTNVKKQQMTGDKCTDKAIKQGDDPDPPPITYDY